MLVEPTPRAAPSLGPSAREAEPLFPVVGMAKPTLHRELPEIAKDYDSVIIDGAPRVNDLGRAAILASDLVLIPVQPSPMMSGSGRDGAAHQKRSSSSLI